MSAGAVENQIQVGGVPSSSASVTRRKEVNSGDRRFVYLLRFMGVAVILLLLGFIVELFTQSLPALKAFGPHFFVDSNWDPVNEKFGALAFAYGTVVTSLLALAISIPISLSVAIFLTELAPSRIAAPFAFLVDMLAAIPSVVYGLWGIAVVAPLLQTQVQPWLGENFGFLPLFQGAPYGVSLMAAGIILAIMITPTISALCREVFKAIPDSQREAALGLGATRWEMIRLAVLKSSYSGIAGAVMLGFGRALGETMAVTMVIGNRAEISSSLFAPGQSMASIIANEYAEAMGHLHISSLVLVGLALFGVSTVVNSSARLIVWRVTRNQRGGR